MKEFIGNSLIARLKPKEKAYDIWDTKLTGFILRVLPNGMMVYRCEYARGKRITLGKTTVLSPARARDQAREVFADVIKGNLPQANKQKFTLPTLNEYIKNHYESWRYSNRKAAKNDMQRLKNKFANKHGGLLLTEITPLVIEKWRSERITKDGIRPITANRDIAVIKALLNKAVEWKIITENPLQAFKLSSADSIAKVRYLTKDEESRLLQALKSRETRLKAARQRGNKWRNERDYGLLPDLALVNYADHMTPMILLSLNTGLRKGEVFNLLWERINFDLAILTVSGDTAKSGKTRHMPLNSVALQVLKNWHKQTQGHGLVFPNKKSGEAFDNVKKAWLSILDLAEIKNFRWHDMRHHFASKLVMAGVDLNTVRELLGHADIKMTLRYAHLAPEHKAKAVEKLVTSQEA
jgi:integrase